MGDNLKQSTELAAEKRSVAVTAALFASGTMLSRILGLVRDMMTARYFSVDVRDAFVNAFRLPNLFRRLLGEGALSVSFIPVFVEVLTFKEGNPEEGHQRARKLVSGVFSILLAITLTLSLLGILYMDQICQHWLSGEEYTKIPGKMELTIRLGRIMFGFLVLITMYAFFMAVLNSLRKFAMGALAPCFFNIALISAALISDRYAAPEEVLAWSVIAGGFLQMVVMIPQLYKAGYLPKLTTAWSSPDLAKVFKAIGPSLFGMSVVQITTVVNGHFASHLPQGTHSYLYFADRILELPLATLAVSMGSALLPTLARYWAHRNIKEMGEILNHYLRILILVSIPAAAGMFLLSMPIVELLFMGGKFSLQDALSTAVVIRVYAFGLLVTAAVRVLVQGFYAVQNTWFPAVAAAVSLVSHLLLVWVLTKQFGLVGLAASSITSSAVNLSMLVVAYHRWIAPLQFLRNLVFTSKCLVCALPLGLMCYYFPQYFVWARSHLVEWPVTMVRAMTLLSLIAAAAASYFAAAMVLRVEEVNGVKDQVVGKISRKLGIKARSAKRKS